MRGIGIIRWCMGILIMLLLLLLILLRMIRVLGILLLLIISLLRVLALSILIVTLSRLTAMSSVSVRLRSEGTEELTNNPCGPGGYLRHRPRIGPLVDRAESLRVVEVHKDSPGPEVYSHLEHHHIEGLETDSLVVRKVAGHKVAAVGHSLGMDRDAGPDEG